MTHPTRFKGNLLSDRLSFFYSKQLCHDQMAPLLLSLPRLTMNGNQSEYGWKSISDRQYKFLNQSLNIINQLLFRFKTEDGRGFTKLSNLILYNNFI